ncbi:MAG: gliding motility-associated C-terminal domain-containing protein [Bacteroidales bacterium]|nr:gliding motility-associated C-terminal domain-containing protein [Bacteroidales bacterium]
MKIFGKLILVLLFISSSLYVSGQTIVRDTTFITMCENEYFSDIRFDSISVDSMIVVRDSENVHSISGIYSNTIKTVLLDGSYVDSVFNLIASFNPIYNDTIFENICIGEVFNQFGFIADTTAIYTRSLQTYLGCDSIINLSLTVNPIYNDTIYDTICYGDIYEYGFDADTTGTYTQLLTSTMGCDSILVLYLVTNPTYSDTIFAEIYKGNVYNKFGFNEKETGVYEQKYLNYLGCDSIIYLDLQVDYAMFPNVVTPNGDGVNDIFEIHNLIDQDAFPENELIIYSRQGKKIYQAKNIKSREDFWDPQKTRSTDGTYFYRFFGKRPDKTLEFNGSIEILR